MEAGSGEGKGIFPGSLARDFFYIRKSLKEVYFRDKNQYVEFTVALSSGKKPVTKPDYVLN